MVHRHIAQHPRFDLYLLGVGLPHDFHTRLQLFFAQHMCPLEHLHAFRSQVTIEHLRCGYRAIQSAPSRLPLPLLGVPVSIEMNRFAFTHIPFEYGINGFHRIFAIPDTRIDSCFELGQLIGHRRIQHGHRSCTVGRRPDGAKFKAIAGKGKRGGTVAVGIVQQQFRNMWNPFHLDAVKHNLILTRTTGHFVEHLRELAPQENRNNGRRGLVGPKAVRIGRIDDARFQQSVVSINRHHHIHQKCNELQIVFRGLAGREQVHSGIRPQRPVAVLAGAIDSLEGFLMQQRPETVFAADAFDCRHQQQVVVVGKVRFFIYRRQFELVRRHFVMTCLNRNPQLPAFIFELFHESHHPGRNRPEIMIFQLLVFRTLMPDQRAAGQHQVGPGRPQSFVHQEILLLPA